MKRDLCIMACVFCRDPLFQAWLTEMNEIIHPGDVAINEAGAKAFILSICKVDTRNKLDTDAVAGARFMDLVREPFLAWKDDRS